MAACFALRRNGASPPRGRAPAVAASLPTSRGWVVLLVLLALSLCASARQEHYEREAFVLQDAQIQQLVQLEPAPWKSVHEGHLGKLLIPRASGTENNTLVQQYISSVFAKLDWHEEKTAFTSETPIGEIEFTNIIYTFNPDAPRKIVLSAHFDSKYFPDFPANQFIGATDSAAPCSMLMSLAEALTPLLRARQERVDSGQGLLRDGFDEEVWAETTIQLVFFDGEEAIKDWTTTDSIYGARHLANLWQETILEPSHPLARRRISPPPTVLNTIDVLVLLDLLGHMSPRLHSYYRETDWLFDNMKSADERLQKLKLVEVEAGEFSWFNSMRLPKGMIGDDHVPFSDRGVSVLHIISNPFPSVWHNLGDDASALSLPAMRRWNSILRVFAAEYLGLSPEDGVQRRAVSNGQAAHMELTPHNSGHEL